MFARPYMTMYVQGHVDIGKKVPLCKAASRKPQAALSGTREKRPSPPGSFFHLVELRKGWACMRTRLPIERGAVGPVTSSAISISFEGIGGVAITRISHHRIASHRKCSAINAMLTATQAQAHAHARTRKEPPIVRSSWCVAEPSLTAAPTVELMGNVCKVAGI